MNKGKSEVFSWTTPKKLSYNQFNYSWGYVKMRAILVDDEPIALDFLEMQLKKVSNISIVGKFQSFNPQENKKLLEQIEIAFLDIDMPYLNGIVLATEMLNINHSLLIIFVTAYNDFATEAFELSAFDYLVKPVRLDRLRKTCERIEAALSSKGSSLKTNEKSILVRVGEELKVEMSDGSIHRLEWRTLKVKELFSYLLHKKERSVLKSKLAELLWPSILPEISYPRLYTLVYQLRKTISPYQNQLTIESTDEGYTLNLKNASVDLIEWERQLDLFQTLHPDNIQAFEKVMKLYSGPYLGKYDYIWAEAERYRLEQLYLSKASQLAHYYEQEGNIQQAVNWYIKICAICPEHEETVQSLLKGLDKIGNLPLVTYYYQQFEKTIADLQIEMGEEIKEWYTNWKERH